jgi:hypothetical protein
VNPDSISLSSKDVHACETAILTYARVVHPLGLKAFLSAVKHRTAEITRTSK